MSPCPCSEPGESKQANHILCHYGKACPCSEPGESKQANHILCHYGKACPCSERGESKQADCKCEPISEVKLDLIQSLEVAKDWTVYVAQTASILHELVIQ